MQLVGSPIFSSPFDEKVAFVVLPIKTDYELHPDEAGILSSRACWKRRCEFTSGRAAARLALEQLGLESPAPVLRGEGGEPRWPEGVVGSIAHCEAWAVAAAARRSVALTLGIDLEELRASRADGIAGWICHEAELDWVLGSEAAWERTAMLFSAKEAVLKAWYPLCKRPVEFQEVKLSWNAGREQFQGELMTTMTPHLRQGYRFEVGCRREGDLVLSHMFVPPLPGIAEVSHCPGQGPWSQK